MRSKNRGFKNTKMDGLFHGKPYEQMDDFGGFPIIFGNTHIEIDWVWPPPRIPLFVHRGLEPLFSP